MRGIIIGSPDDMHVHFRRDNMLQLVLPYTSNVFTRGVAMGNLPRPIETADEAESYRDEILEVDPDFQPIMTIMLTKNTTPEILREAHRRGIRHVKYMPAAASTNSSNGIELPDLLLKYSGLLEEMRDLGMFLLGHWTFPIAGGNFQDELEEERRAIPYLNGIVRFFPTLRITVEHVSTRDMVDFVRDREGDMVATIAIQHAYLNYLYLVNESGQIINPYHYCKPVLNYEADQIAVQKAMISGNPKFFFGSDSAPHPMSAKRKIPPAAGIFSAPVALPLLCEMFEKNNSLHRLEAFVSRFGAQRYELPLNDGEIFLRREEWFASETVGDVKVFMGGEKLGWKVYS